MAARQLSDARTDGQKLGQSATDKVAFHGATPVVQRSGAAQAAVSTTASTTTTPAGYATTTQANAIVTLVNELRAAMVEKGIIAGA
jgi:UDP-N-acetyl-D-mannosaminuronic acid transferase (WecB/TagA/CpsF family)